MKHNPKLNLYLKSLMALILPGSILGIICILTSVLTMSVNTIENPFRYYRFMNSYIVFFNNGEPMAAAIAPALAAFMYIGPALFTYIVFKHLNNRSASDFYDSLPYSRTSGYLSRLAAVFTWQYTIIILTLLASVISMSVNGISYNHTFIPKLMLSFMASSALVTGACAIAISITGNIVSNMLATGAILFSPRVLLFIVDRLIVGMPSDYFVDLSHTGIFLNPVYNIPTAVILDITKMWEYYGTSETLINIGAILYTFILGLLYLGAGFLLMRKRKSELAGNGTSSPILRHILSAAVALPFLCYSIYNLFSYGSIRFSVPDFLQNSLAFVAIGLFVFGACQYILSRRIKSVFTSVPVFLTTLLCSVVFVFAGNKISNSIKNYVPDVDDIEYIKIDENYSAIYQYNPTYTYIWLLTKEIEYADNEVISLLHTSLEKTVEEYNTMRQGTYGMSSSFGTLQCEFKLKNGKSVFRNLKIYGEDWEQLESAITSNPEYLSLAYTLPTLDEISSVMTYSQGLDKNLYQSFKNEYDNSDFETKSRILYSYGYQTFFRTYYQEYRENVEVPYSLGYFNIRGKKNGSRFYNLFYINSLMPETGELYMNEINKLSKDVIMNDLREAPFVKEEYYNFRMDIEFINASRYDLYEHTTIAIYYDNYSEANSGFSQEELIEISELLSSISVDSVSFDAPLIRIHILKHANVEKDYTSYSTYANLSEENFVELYNLYINSMQN